MTRKRRPLLVISAIALTLALGTMGCGKDEEPQVASANPSATTADGTAGGSQASPIKYSRCMREQGLTWYPDPQADGGLSVSVPDGTDPKKLEAAETACKKYYPGGGKSGKAPAEDIAKIQKAAKCMREHGVTNYPDPDANGNLHIDEKLGIDNDDPTVKKAQQECQKFFPTGQEK
ncbi:hypothetical protein [Streptomyces sp. NPDC002088]|uniref:hypothetical protein n=1 Tax=Streptomyces sp. NPDC002088 TaxID=3154665 RepID=UPI00332C6611